MKYYSEASCGDQFKYLIYNISPENQGYKIISFRDLQWSYWQNAWITFETIHVKLIP